MASNRVGVSRRGVWTTRGSDGAERPSGATGVASHTSAGNGGADIRTLRLPATFARSVRRRINELEDDSLSQSITGQGRLAQHMRCTQTVLLNAASRYLTTARQHWVSTSIESASTPGQSSLSRWHQCSAEHTGVPLFSANRTLVTTVNGVFRHSNPTA